MRDILLHSFVKESNRIEGIIRDPTEEEIKATSDFLTMPWLRALSIARLAQIYQPGAQLRLHLGMNIRVGSHTPPTGGAQIGHMLEDLLAEVSDRPMTVSPYDIHCRYETLHPLTDGNGRTGRALWLWHMLKLDRRVDLGFLHTWYYQSLQHKEPK